MKSLTMDTIDNKFIIMSRIAVSLRKKGLTASVTIAEDYCCMFVHFGREVVENVYSTLTTEHDLLEWWAIIDGEQ